MLNVLKGINFNKIVKELINIIRRFPLAFISIWIVFICIMILNNFSIDNNTNEIVIKLTYSGVILFFLTIGIDLFCESINAKNKSKFYMYLGAIIYSAIFTIYIQKGIIHNSSDFIYFAISIIAIITFGFIAPYIKILYEKKYDQNVYFTYFYNICLVFLKAIIIGNILLILGYFGLSTIITLFELSTKINYYANWLTISYILITPIVALSLIPDKKSYNNNYFNENLFFSFIIKYIAIPFIYLYFIILYLYSIKVLINFGTWPKGEVSWLVISFSVLGYIIYVFSYIFKNRYNYIRVFRKYFPFVVIPQVFMLFYSVYLRINQYDLTLNRYLVLIFGVWLLIISIYLAISNKKYIIHMFSILLISIILVSIGPWSIYSLPYDRQYNRLIKNLEIANILNDGKITPLENNTDISPELSKDIYSGIDYLCGFDNCTKIHSLFKGENFQINENNTHWNIVNMITTYINVSMYYTNKESQFTYAHLKGDIFPIKTDNINKIHSISNFTDSQSNYNINYNKNKNLYKIYYQNDKIFELNIEEIRKDILEKVLVQYHNRLEKEELTYYIDYKNKSYKVIIKSIGLDINIDPEILFDIYLIELKQPLN